MTPRLLDLFACAGGAAVGYTRAGFDVWGVDIEHRKAYPYPLLVADAMKVLEDEAFIDLFDAIHASPPCQENSRTRCLREAQGGTVKENGQDLLGPVREALERIGKPYVIENVPDAPMRRDLGRPLGVYGTPADDIPSGGQTCRSVKEASELMGIDWMTRWNDIKEAIPPAYTERIGQRLLAAIGAVAA